MPTGRERAIYLSFRVDAGNKGKEHEVKNSEKVLCEEDVLPSVCRVIKAKEGIDKPGRVPLGREGEESRGGEKDSSGEKQDMCL